MSFDNLHNDMANYFCDAEMTGAFTPTFSALIRYVVQMLLADFLLS